MTVTVAHVPDTKTSLPETNSHVIEWDDNESTAAPGLCCLQGCLAASAVGFSFFIALPTGIILVVLSSSNHDNALLGAGCVLVSLPLIMLIIVIVLCLNQKRLKCLKKKIKRRKKLFEESSTIETTVASGLSPSSTGIESPV